MRYLVAFMSVLVTACISIPSPTLDQQLDDAISRLQQESNIPLEFRFEKGIAIFSSMDVALPTASQNNPAHRSLEFINRYKQLYQLENPHQELFLLRVIDDKTQTRVIFGQKVDNVPVFGAYISMRIESGRIRNVAANLSPISNSVNSEPKLSRDQAEIAVAQTGILLSQARVLSRLMILDRSLLGEHKSSPHLVWRVGVGPGPGIIKSDYFVSAEDGNVLFSVVRRFDIDFSIRDSDSMNITDLTSCATFGGFIEMENESGRTADFDPSVPDVTAAAAHTRRTYDYFSMLGFDGFDNRDSRIDVAVNFDFCPGPDNKNAFFSPGCNQFYFDPGLTSLDVYGHEYTHGVIEHTADLIYSGQSGAVNESFADVFGSLVENRNWLIGESTPLGAIRDLSDPPSIEAREVREQNISNPCAPRTSRPVCGTFSSPDRMSDFRTMSDICDSGGVHINSGILNKVSYLLATGGIHYGVSVNPIGRSKLGALYLSTLQGLGNSADFIMVRDEAVSQASSFERTRRHGFNSMNVCSVRKAFFTVGLGTDCSYRPRDRDGDYIEDDVDNCPDIRNTRQANIDGDDDGDVCDEDMDGDGIINNIDSCPSRSNRGIDRDDDGTDCACDDNDGDHYNNCDDNCWTIFNPDQSNIDEDEFGDICDNDIDGDGILNPFDLCPVMADTGLDDDGDGVDNACDLCPELDDLAYDPDGPPGEDDPFNFAPAPIRDSDGDGIGDPCDPDDDNDGICDVVTHTVNEEGEHIPDIPEPGTPGLAVSGCVSGPNHVDNCPNTANRRQIDIDSNGKGLLCDSGEAQMLDGNFVNILRGLHLFSPTQPPFILPINPCLADGPNCPDYLSPASTITIRLTLPFEQTINVIDQNGRFVGAFTGTPNGGQITLPVDPALYFKASADTQSFAGNTWYVEIPGTTQASGEPAPFEMNVDLNYSQ